MPPAIRFGEHLTVRRADFVLAAAVAVGMATIGFGVVGVNRTVLHHLFNAETSSLAHRWAKDFVRVVPDLPELLRKRILTPETGALIRASRDMGGVFSFKLFNSEGDLILHSEDLDDLDKAPESVRTAVGGIDLPEAVLQGEIIVEMGSGTPPAMPAKFAGAHVPLLSHGELVGMAEIYFDQTDKQSLFEKAFLWIGVSSVVLALLAGIAPALLTRQRIKDRQQTHRRMLHLAHHDPLTGLANRTQLDERLRTSLAAARRQQVQVAVLALDLDHFKAVNDALGHPAGDALLCAVGTRLRAQVRAEDYVVRLGGDEFAVVQINSKQPEGAAMLAERIVGILGEPFDLPHGKVSCGASVGISVFPDDGDTPELLLRNADIALYEAKRSGRGAFRFFEKSMEAALHERRSLEADLRQALAQNSLQLYFQPICKLPDRVPVGYEALLRWRHPTRAMVSPATFIPIAEETGLIHQIGAWVLEEACCQAAEWPERYKVSVNLSPVQFKSGNLVSLVSAALSKSGIAPERLQLEITEGTLLENSETVRSDLQQLHDIGVTIAMDDFGTGYSSLGSIWQFPFDTIKIDQSFIRSAPNSPKALAIIDTILVLGRTLGMDVTVEGVETEEQTAALLDLGCEQVQGYLFGRPCSQDTSEIFVKAFPGPLYSGTDKPPSLEHATS